MNKDLCFCHTVHIYHLYIYIYIWLRMRSQYSNIIMTKTIIFYTEDPHCWALFYVFVSKIVLTPIFTFGFDQTTIEVTWVPNSLSRLCLRAFLYLHVQECLQKNGCHSNNPDLRWSSFKKILKTEIFSDIKICPRNPQNEDTLSGHSGMGNFWTD